MIKEISNFISNLDLEFKSLGVKPKSGLHVLLSFTESDGGKLENNIEYVYTGKKEHDSKEILLLEKTSKLAQFSWMIDTNKCLDTRTRAIHSASPFCLAIKRDNLIGGDNYNKRKNDDKALVYESLENYFKNAQELLPELKSEVIKQSKYFIDFLDTEIKIHAVLSEIEEYELLKKNDYIIFYLETPIEFYEKTNTIYLADKLFNTSDYNKEVDGEIYGTSGFLNSFSTKKQFLMHQSASFDIAGRISSKKAKDLYEFQDILSRNILPKPLPIFIHEEELKKQSIHIFKKEAEEGNKIGYREIIEELYSINHYKDLGNYYLLFYERGEVKDFDFVSKFEYNLKDADGNNWEIKDYFKGENAQPIKNVFHFQQTVLQPVFNNGLVTRTKNGSFQYKYFDEIDNKYCKSDTSYIQILKYRKAFYDFIYKSKRQSITSQMFYDILQASILEDIRLDEIKNNYHTEERNIRQKLNIWFSLTNNFINAKNNQVMSSKLQTHREFILQLADGKANISTDEEYAFTVGQIIYYLLSKSKTADRSYKRLEPFMQQVHSKELNKSIARLFDAYKHENFSRNFRAPFAQVLSYETKVNVRDLIPTMLSGIFSDNVLFSGAEKEEESEVITEIEN